MKVLHVVENLNRGAVENWLVRMLQWAHRKQIVLDWTFYCALGSPGQLDDLAKDAGAKIIFSPVPIRNKIQFMSALRKELKQGQYDALHCHHDIISGVYLVAAAGLPIRRRIVHVHNADESVLTSNRIKQAIVRPTLRQVCIRSADRILGISNHTLNTFLAGRTRKSPRDQVHYYGIDPTPFLKNTSNRGRFRELIGVPADALVLLFAGRVVPEKNPLFAVDVLAELSKSVPQAYGVFAGSGSLEDSVKQRATELGVSDRVCMLGFQSDIASIMKECDWFILPRPEHPKEGLGIAVIEAQLAGLRLLISDGIADDPLLPNASYRRLKLAEGPKKWAEAAVELLNQIPPSTTEAAASLSQSAFDMDYALTELMSLYE